MPTLELKINGETQNFSCLPRPRSPWFKEGRRWQRGSSSAGRVCHHMLEKGATSWFPKSQSSSEQKRRWKFLCTQIYQLVQSNQWQLVLEHFLLISNLKIQIWNTGISCLFDHSSLTARQALWGATITIFKMGELDMVMSDNVIRPSEGSHPSIFKQGSVQAFVKQATDIKLFDMKSNRGDWSTLHGLCGEAGQADSQCLRMNLEDDHSWYLSRPSRPAVVYFLQRDYYRPN